jgi:hypothetical protein
MRNAAIFMTEEDLLARPLEGGSGSRHATGEQHQVDVRVVQRKAVNDISAGGDERHGGARRYADLVRREKPDAGHDPGLIPSRANLDYARCVERRRLRQLRRVDAAGIPRHMDPRAEGGHHECHQHADGDGDAWEDPGQLIQIDGCPSHRRSSSLDPEP